MHGQDQYRVWHVIAVWFRTGQDRSKSWAAQIQAGTRQGQGQAQYKAGQVEPTRDTLEPDPSKDTVQPYVQVRDAKKTSRSQDPRPVPHYGKIWWDQREARSSSLITTRGPTPDADSFDRIP